MSELDYKRMWEEMYDILNKGVMKRCEVSDNDASFGAYLELRNWMEVIEAAEYQLDDEEDKWMD